MHFNVTCINVCLIKSINAKRALSNYHFMHVSLHLLSHLWLFDDNDLGWCARKKKKKEKNLSKNRVIFASCTVKIIRQLGLVSNDRASLRSLTPSPTPYPQPPPSPTHKKIRLPPVTFERWCNLVIGFFLCRKKQMGKGQLNTCYYSKLLSGNH